METKLIIASLKQAIKELQYEKYQQEKNGLAKAALNFVEILETQVNGDDTGNDKCHIQNVVGSKPTGLMVESGKSYRLRHPNGAGDKDRLHIDYILDNPTNSHWSYKLVVCRYWGKHKQRWFYYTYPYFSLAIYNDFDYGKDDV